MKKINKKSSPDKVELSADELSDLKKKITASNLDSTSQDLILKSLQGIIWLSRMLEAKKLSIRKLSKLFGIKTEKSKKNKNDDNNKPSGGAGNTTSSKNKGHGRNSKNDYSGAEKVFHEHSELESGDRCPSCSRGNLYEINSGTFIYVKGNTPLHATIHQVQKFRCGACGEIFTAEAPKEVRKQKYDETADVAIALLKYGMGMPFNRLADLQKHLGIPLPASTQWERVESLADVIWPIYEALIREAACGDRIFIDDTTGKVLDLKKQLLEDKSNRIGIYTSGIISESKDKIINLFFTGNKHAGENLDRVLNFRPNSLGNIIQMCDASSNNNTKKHTTIKSLCMTHGRRNFVDIMPDRPKECEYVIYLLGKIYHNEKIAIQQNLDDNTRLVFHKKKSAHWMKKLRRWCLKCFYLKKVEPNEPLGEAIQYLLNHWKGLTEFLRTPGAPLDNNIAERLIKRSILHRKNALFFKTTLGAYVADIIMSLIETCKSAGKNPFAYLLFLYKNRKPIKNDPTKFFPWNYEENILIAH